MDFLLVTLLLVAGSDGEAAEQPGMRTWTDIQGREIVALFVDFKDGEVHLKKKHDGKLYRCPLERLSQPDQEYATRQTLPPEDIRPTPRERWKEYRDRKTGERFIVKQLDRVVMPGGIRKVYIELENGLRYWIVEQHYEVSDPGDRRGPGRDPGKGEKRLGPPVIDVVVEGFGSDPGEAIQEALSQAIEQAVGVLVDSETQVVGDTITRDEILTWSRGFVQGYRAVKRWQEEGLHYVLIVASVTKEKLVEGLKEKQLEVRALPGDVIAYRLLHERRAREDAARMIREVLEDASMDRLCTATLINNPIDEAFEFERDENQAGLPVRVRVSVDQEQQRRLYEQLRMLLDYFAYRQNEFTLTAEARTEDSWYVVPNNSTEIEQAYYRLYYPIEPGPEREIVCLSGDRLESGMTSRWGAFLVDKSIYEELADVYHRQCELRIELADGENNVLSRTRLPLARAAPVRAGRGEAPFGGSGMSARAPATPAEVPAPARPAEVPAPARPAEEPFGGPGMSARTRAGRGEAPFGGPGMSARTRAGRGEAPFGGPGMSAHDSDPPHMIGFLNAGFPEPQSLYTTIQVSAPALGPFVWKHWSEGGWSPLAAWYYCFSFEIEGAITLEIDKLKDVRHYYCSIERAQGAGASAPQPPVGMRGPGMAPAGSAMPGGPTMRDMAPPGREMPAAPSMPGMAPPGSGRSGAPGMPGSRDSP